jgi:hypothetical protein
MASPTTDIEIMSTAAVLLGKKAFTTIDDADEFAVSCQKFFDLLVESELAQNHWKFCKKQVQLSQVAGFDPDFAAWNAAYDLPADFLALVRLYPRIPYQIFGKRVYCSTQGTLKLEYSSSIPVSYWSAPFKEYMVYALASKLAPAVALDAALMQAFVSERNIVRSTAMYIDAQNSPNTPIQSNPWIAVRTGGFGSGSGSGWNY